MGVIAIDSLLQHLAREFLSVHDSVQTLRLTISALPRGTIVAKSNHHGRYAFFALQFNQDGRQKQQYIAKARVPQLRAQIDSRRALTEKLRELQDQLQQLTRALRAFRLKASDLLRDRSARLDALRTNRSQLAKRRKQAAAQYYGDSLKHVTNRGEYVRSKSELVIANSLTYFKLAYRYDVRLFSGFDEVCVDFAVEDQATGATWYWEHCGMMKDAAYAARWAQKREILARHGILEGANLIVTYDDPDGGLNSMTVQNIIERYFFL